MKERRDKKIGPGKIFVGIREGNITKIIKRAKNIFFPIAMPIRYCL